MFKLVLEKAGEPEIKLPASVGSWKEQESSRKASTSALLTMRKPLTVWIHNKLWKILKEMGIPDHLTCLPRDLYAVKKQQLELDMEQQTGSKLGKEYIKAVYCHPAYFKSLILTCVPKHEPPSHLPPHNISLGHPHALVHGDDLSFLNVELSQLFHSLLLLSSRGFLVPLHFLP